MKQDILSYLPTECPWRDTLYWYDSIDSTNTKAKELAQSGAPQGTVVLAGHQTAGKGRLGRSFSSPDRMGMYLSVILRPNCKPEQLMHLTCAAAVAAVRAVERACGIRPGIKWINDLVVNRKKLGGILTELSLDPVSCRVDYAIVGIGINCTQTRQDFPAPVQDMATSLYMLTGQPVAPAAMAAAMIDALAKMAPGLLSQKEQIMAEYAENCITLGQDIMVSQGDQIRYGRALGLDEDGGLLVQLPDGTRETVQSGEASIRGMYGYV